MVRRSLSAVALALLVSACQPPAVTPKAAETPAAPTPAADAPAVDDAAIPAMWQEADGPGVTAIFVEDQGQRVGLECSRADSIASSAPGKLIATAMWRDGENPPQAQDVALNVGGANYDGAPIWRMEGKRAAVSITLDPSRAMIAHMQQADAGLRMIAGDWFLPVAPDTRGVLKRFAETCATLTTPKK